MQMTLGRKLFFYSSGLLIGVLLLAFAVLERTQARQWQEHLQHQQVAFARFATPELLKHFRGDFSQAAGPAHREQLKGVLGVNPDLVKLSIVSPGGRVLFDPPPFDSRYQLPDMTIDIDWASSALDPVTRAVELADGQRLLEVVAPVFGPSGARVLNVRYLFSFASVEQRLAEMHRSFLTIAFVAVGLTLLLVGDFSRRFSRPVQQLIQGVRAVSRGELETTIPSRGRDELATLATAFNEMATSLSQKQQELETRNQQLRQANGELQLIQERLLRTERLAVVGQLAAGVSHEIDNPVGIILGYAELLLEDFPPDDPRAEDLQGIIDECHRCKRITGGLLGLARSGTPQREPVELVTLALETAASLRPQKLFRQIVLNVNGEQPLQVIGDADRLRQVLVNLLLNAAQALQGEGEVQIDLRREGAQAVVEVRDNGPGIDAVHLEQIFEPFYSTKQRSAGTGLGLSVCRNLIEEHGGEICALSPPQGGALLRLKLPLGSQPE